MKKNIIFITFLLLHFLFLFTIYSFGLSAKKNNKPTLTIHINEKGEEVKAEPERKSFYEKDDEIFVIIKSEVKTYYYVGEQIEELAEPESISVFGLEELKAPKALAQPEKVAEFKFTLSKRGVKHRLKITRYDNEDDKLKKTNGAIIFNETFQTYKRYYLGSYIGIYIPLKLSDEYEIGYKQPTDANPSIIKNSVHEVKSIFFISVYPFGFEPDKKMSIKNFHFNVGSEISNLIFKNWYFGVGYSFRKYFSLDVIIKYGKVDQLREGFSEGEIDPTIITSVPLDSKSRLRYGFSLSFSFNFASLLGEFFGL